MSELGGLECFWSDLEKHPRCPHGPALLFGRYNNGELKQFYACSACRDRKLCTFYAEKDAKFKETDKKAWKEEAKKTQRLYNHRRLFIRFNEAIAESPEKRGYCHSCNKLVLFAERSDHSNHDLQLELTDREMNNPTTILKPLANVKKEAQYLFSEKTTTEITNMLVKAGAEQVLCIGTPKIHEHIIENFQHKISSLLLDFDGRFHNFFGPLNYCWYNLFNNHFFTDEAAQTFRDFITQNKGKNTFVICDPPFGGRVEAISQTLKTISDLHRKLNGIKDDGKDSELKIFFVFPYFMESIIQRKSNPPDVEGGLKGLKMADYKVDYDNHPLFLTGSGGRKFGSPVRIFTNISLSLLELPATDGYKLCKKCQKWVSSENKHCKKCKACTSKDGRRYKHCDLCQRCVKPTWKHCESCERCTLEKHACGGKPRVSGRCFKCGDPDHVEKDCVEQRENVTTGKRKIKRGETNVETKKRKLMPLKNSKIEENVEVVEETESMQPESKKNKRNGTNSSNSIAKKDKKFKKKTTPIEMKDDDMINKTNETVDDSEEKKALSTKEAKKMRRIMKKAPIEWTDVENTKKRKNNLEKRGIKKKSAEIRETRVKSKALKKS